MSSHYERGYRDGKRNEYSPPHQKSVLGEMFGSSYTKRELEDRREYDQGRRHGYRDR